MIVTSRLVLSELREGDADFIVHLLNDRDFIRYIGDKGVRDTEGAIRYMNTGPIHMYCKHGFGLWKVSERESGKALGLCGLLQREGMPFVDIGYAFLPDARGRGVAFEACKATLEYAKENTELESIAALVSPDNVASIALIKKLGLTPTCEWDKYIDMQPTRVFKIALPTEEEAQLLC
ncbi:GNAT family N-acetyltransferase [Aestuariibacter sp. AA17]|uniref:GNAT family N-acetyltransferase n=1 Tax=Fluctibacter corallii TaxID=2984329 RepID=A0ABT3A4G2_9ALTE|nr:GNAT family N-acetyltransferase [Aestuariibacter sp. AA17]MCV2883575.1 GNAT family N-acetyltransferase [Aestuariibacter sp. AA17]